MPARPRILDLFCGAGGAAMGYHQAGFDVVGIDVVDQPRYPFEFLRADLSRARVKTDGFDAIHASPPCKVHTKMRTFAGTHHGDLIPLARRIARRSGLPYVIENVPGAALLDPVMLCGSMFKRLRVRRHRLFELSFPMPQPRCAHEDFPNRGPLYPVKEYHRDRPVTMRFSPVIGVYGGGQGLGDGEIDMWRAAMGIDWMMHHELAEAIPPAYTRKVGRRLLEVCRAR